MKSFENIIAWQKSHRLVLEVYKITSNFPIDEKYGLTSQIRRSVSSVPLNIVEGRARRSTKDFLRFLYQARGSMEEFEYLMMLSKDLKYLNIDQYNYLETIRSETGKTLQGLIFSLEKKLVP